jgi:hypothetical protein
MQFAGFSFFRSRDATRRTLHKRLNCAANGWAAFISCAFEIESRCDFTVGGSARLGKGVQCDWGRRGFFRDLWSKRGSGGFQERWSLGFQQNRQLWRRFETRAMRTSFRAGSSVGGAGSASMKCGKFESQEGEAVSSAGRSGNGVLWFFRDDCRWFEDHSHRCLVYDSLFHSSAISRRCMWFGCEARDDYNSGGTWFAAMLLHLPPKIWLSRFPYAVGG